MSTPTATTLQFQPNAYPPGVGTISTIVQVPDVAPNPADGTLPAPVWQPIYNVASLYQNDPTFGPLMTAGYIGMQLPAAPAEQPLYIPPGTTFPLAANTRFPYGISHESESVSRKFRLALTGTTVKKLAARSTWSNNDPYEYAWYSLQNPGNTANPGVLIFNPSGHNQPSVNTAGSQPLTARVDYRIFDNHIIRDDKSVPASAPYTIALSLPFLKLGGLVLDNQNVLKQL